MMEITQQEQDTASEGTDGNTIDATPVIDDLIIRTKTLLSELEAFRNRLRSLRQDGNVELGHFRGAVQSELTMLERLSSKPETESTIHAARSSNLPFLEHVWAVAKRSKDLVALHKRVYLDLGLRALSQGIRHLAIGEKSKQNKGSKADAVLVDVITDGGRTWSKISLITNNRLLFDLAKQGWEVGDSDTDDDDEILPRQNDDDDDQSIPLLKTARELTRAAGLFRVRTRHPSVQIILPRIQLGETLEVDRVIKSLKDCGATVVCGEDSQPPPQFDDAVHMMASDPMLSFSSTLNIDCTILLALVSEFSHARVSKEPWFHAALQRQVEIEGNENLLPALLYPALGDRSLVCTVEAAQRMREIVDTIGTPSEKARTEILMGDDSTKTQKQLVEELQQWSAYEVPEHWQLPILMVSHDPSTDENYLPDVAKRLGGEMSSINRSVFLCGWSSGRTTITSNRAVVKQIELEIGKCENLEDSEFPSIWLCPTARSLVGKEKRGASKEDKTEKAMRLPDPLRREHQRRNGLDILSKREGHEVEDLRPNGYPCDDVIAAKISAQR